MGSTFSTKSGFLKGNHRERLMFMAAAGLAFSLIVILVVVLNFRKDADAKSAAKNEVKEAAPVIGTVTLFTPESLIPAGTRLADAKFKELYWNRAEVPEGAVRDIAELMHQYAKVDISPGVPIQRMSLTMEPIRSGLPLTPGNRAVTIEVDAASSIEGHALPGTRVDVVLTHRVANEMTSRVIVQNARVLSYGGDQRSGNDRGVANKNIQKTTITLDVSQNDALSIQTSRQMGQLSLLLRAPEDNKPSRNIEVDQNAVSGGVNRQQTKASSSACRKGTMKIDGKEYVIDCDGAITQLMENSEP